MPKDLPRKQRVVPVADAERVCPQCGAQRVCIGYRTSEISHMHQVKPLAWATDVLGKLQAGWPESRLDALLPDAWAKTSRNDADEPAASPLAASS